MEEPVKCIAMWKVQCIAIQKLQGNVLQHGSCRVMHCNVEGAVYASYKLQGSAVPKVQCTAKTIHRPFNNSGSFKQSLASVIFQR